MNRLDGLLDDLKQASERPREGRYFHIGNKSSSYHNLVTIMSMKLYIHQSNTTQTLPNAKSMIFTELNSNMISSFHLSYLGQHLVLIPSL
jgi:hypothetical protein